MSKQRKHYAERDIIEMDLAGNYYGRHVSAMTGERLHSKSDIAAELGFRDQRIDALHAEAEALRVALHEIASVNPAQRGIEWAKSYASDGLKGAGSELYARWLETFKEAEALRAENGRLQADRDRANQYANQQALECNKLSTDLEAARGLLESAVVLFACHCTDATAKNWHDAAAAFLTATPAPEVPAGGPYASVADALAQRYPKPSLLKDCNVGYSNSSRPLAEQGERQEAACWVPRACLDKLRNGRNNSPTVLTDGPAEFNDTPLYTAPQPSQGVRALVEAAQQADDVLSAIVRNDQPIETLKREYGEEWSSAIDTVRASLVTQIAAHRQAQRQD